MNKFALQTDDKVKSYLFVSAFVSIVTVLRVAFLWAVIAEMAKVVTHKAAFTSSPTPTMMTARVKNFFKELKHRADWLFMKTQFNKNHV